MTTAQPKLDIPLRLHPLTFLEEGDEVTVGRADINSYALFPADGAALVRRLEAGLSPSEAARWYREEYGEDVDIVEFLAVLEEFELLIPPGEEAAVAPEVRWQRLGRALFSPWAWCAYALIVIAALVAMVRDPGLAPTYQHLFFTRSSLVVLTLGILLGQLPWLLLHEAYHALAGRRLGLNSTLRIGVRFYFLVFETSLDGLVAVPRRKRYLPMLAGILLDVVALSALTLGAALPLGSSGGVAVFQLFLLTTAYGVALRLAWQLYFFLRTDLYYLATTVLGCNDLQTVSRQMLFNRANRLLGRHERLVDESAWHPRDHAVARWYSWLMAAGYGVLSVILVTALIPATVRLADLTIKHLGSHPSAWSVADAVVFLILQFGQLYLVAFIALRNYRRRRSARAAAAA